MNLRCLFCFELNTILCAVHPWVQGVDAPPWPFLRLKSLWTCRHLTPARKWAFRVCRLAERSESSGANATVRVAP